MQETIVLSCHKSQINSGVEKNEHHLNMDYNLYHQMSLSKSKQQNTNNCLHFLKCTVPFGLLNLPLGPIKLFVFPFRKKAFKFGHQMATHVRINFYTFMQKLGIYVSLLGAITRDTMPLSIKSKRQHFLYHNYSYVIMKTVFKLNVVEPIASLQSDNRFRNIN